MPAPFTLRLATPADLPALQALIPRSVRTLARDRYTGAQIESALRHVFGVDSQLVTDGTYFVVTADEVIVGCGGWSRRRTLYGGDQMKTVEDPLLDPATEPARIRAFFVDPQHARRGIGTLILKSCFAAARDAGFWEAELVATLPGEPLYAARGFAVVERLPTQLPDGVLIEFVRMRRSLE